MLGSRTDSGSQLDFPQMETQLFLFLLSLKWTCRSIFLLNSLNDCNVVCIFTFFGVTAKFKPLFKTFSCNELSFRSLRLTCCVIVVFRLKGICVLMIFVFSLSHNVSYFGPNLSKACFGMLICEFTCTLGSCMQGEQ